MSDSTNRSSSSTPEVAANGLDPFPRPTADEPIEMWHDDWRQRLIRNLSRRSEGRWEPLTYVTAKSK